MRDIFWCLKYQIPNIFNVPNAKCLAFHTLDASAQQVLFKSKENET